MENLFVYGTLRNQSIQKKILGDVLIKKKDSYIEDVKLLNDVEIKNKKYPRIVYEKNGIVFGTIYKISKEQLVLIDKYETDNYNRLNVFINSSDKAWTYFADTRNYTSPHTNVYTRLGVSKKHGIGVFAIMDIESGTDIFKMDTLNKIVEISEDEVENLPDGIKKLYHDFCPLNNGVYTCPETFSMLTPSWYLNHSDNNNVDINEKLSFVTNRKIKKGEELLANYSRYSDKPPGEVV